MYLKIFYLRIKISQADRKKNFSLKCQICKVTPINKTKEMKRDNKIFLLLFNLILRLDTHLKMATVKKLVELIVMLAHLTAAFRNMFARLAKLRRLKPFTLRNLRTSALIMGLLFQ